MEDKKESVFDVIDAMFDELISVLPEEEKDATYKMLVLSQKLIDKDNVTLIKLKVIKKFVEELLG